LYVTNETSGDLSVIDVETRKVVGTIPLGKRPRGIAVSPAGENHKCFGAIEIEELVASTGRGVTSPHIRPL